MKIINFLIFLVFGIIFKLVCRCYFSYMYIVYISYGFKRLVKYMFFDLIFDVIILVLLVEMRVVVNVVRNFFIKLVDKLFR